ncbi:succinate--hydroxymethylglutarate CoA-transferase-like, partial [Python bivittatus]|uniref:Succinate--hydroxymethylglutarate CoA-transferase-like n=1 Tax=Python bivittatus TaxID=176946 RepID=A0A9F5N4E3_PYTBI
MANELSYGKRGKRVFLKLKAFRTKDGYIVVGAGNDQQFATVCKILSLPEIIHDPKYKNNQQRVVNRKELIGILSARFLEEETSKWLDLFEGSGVPYGPINSMKQVFSDPQIRPDPAPK